MISWRLVRQSSFFSQFFTFLASTFVPAIPGSNLLIFRPFVAHTYSTIFQRPDKTLVFLALNSRERSIIKCYRGARVSLTHSPLNTSFACVYTRAHNEFQSAMRHYPIIYNPTVKTGCVKAISIILYEERGARVNGLYVQFSRKSPALNNYLAQGVGEWIEVARDSFNPRKTIGR